LSLLRAALQFRLVQKLVEPGQTLRSLDPMLVCKCGHETVACRVSGMASPGYLRSDVGFKAIGPPFRSLAGCIRCMMFHTVLARLSGMSMAINACEDKHFKQPINEGSR